MLPPSCIQTAHYNKEQDVTISKSKKVLLLYIYQSQKQAIKYVSKKVSSHFRCVKVKSLVISDRPSVRTDHRNSLKTNTCEISNLVFVLKSVDIFRLWFKSDKSDILHEDLRTFT
jgi:hypothetical protein